MAKSTILNEIDGSKLINQGYLLLAQKQYRYATEIFLSVLSGDPNNLEALLGLASVFQHQNKTKEAIETAERALAVDPEYFHAYYILAEIYFINKNDNNKAVEYAIKALELEPYDSSIYSLLAQICYFQRNYNECFEYSIRALQIDPRNYIAHMTLGLYYYSKNDFNKAEEHYKVCLEIAPNCSVAFGNYALLNMAFSANRNSYKLLRDAVKLNPEDKFLQENFREVFIRNNPFYSPLLWVTKGLLDDVYLVYGSIVLMLISSYAASSDFGPEIILLILKSIAFLSLLFLVLIVAYRFLVRFFINKFYNWSIKTGKLSKYI